MEVWTVVARERSKASKAQYIGRLYSDEDEVTEEIIRQHEKGRSAIGLKVALPDPGDYLGPGSRRHTSKVPSVGRRRKARAR